MKILYRFVVNKIEEKDVTKESTGANGEKISVTSKEKVEVPHTFVIRQPSRSMFDESECFYAKKVSEYVKQGIIPAVQLQKRYLNDGGVLSEEEDKEYKQLYSTLFAKQSEYKLIKEKKEEEKTPEEKEKESTLLDEMIDIMSDIQSFEGSKSTIYNHTAENLAKNQTVLWWMFLLSYEETGENKYNLVFTGDKFEKNIKLYDEFEEKEDSFYLEVVNRLLLVTNLWHSGKGEKQEDFDVLVKMYQKQNPT